MFKAVFFALSVLELAQAGRVYENFTNTDVTGDCGILTGGKRVNNCDTVDKGKEKCDEADCYFFTRYYHVDDGKIVCDLYEQEGLPHAVPDAVPNAADSRADFRADGHDDFRADGHDDVHADFRADDTANVHANNPTNYGEAHNKAKLPTSCATYSCEFGYDLKLEPNPSTILDPNTYKCCELAPMAERAMGQPQPNIVFMLLDDAGFNDVGWHAGFEFPKYVNPKVCTEDDEYLCTDFTPNLSELAGEGIKLENMYAQSVCSPSRASLLTGLYVPIHGVGPSVIKPCDAHGVPLEFEFFTEKLKERGYRNYMIGKWHLGTASVDMMPTARGFDYFAGNVLGEEDWFTHFRTPGSEGSVDDKWAAQPMRRVDVRESEADDQASWPTPGHFVCDTESGQGDVYCREQFVQLQRKWDETTVWTLDDMIDEMVTYGNNGLEACRGMCYEIDATLAQRVDYDHECARDCMRTKRLQWESNREATFIDNVAEAEIRRVLEQHVKYDEDRGGRITRLDSNRHTPFFLYLPVMQPHLAYNIQVNRNDDEPETSDDGYTTSQIKIEVLAKSHYIDDKVVDWKDDFKTTNFYSDVQSFPFVDDQSTYNYEQPYPDWPTTAEINDKGTFASVCAAPISSPDASEGVCDQKRAYEMMMRNVDDSVGRIRGMLVELNLWNDTIFIMSSDNGGIEIGGELNTQDPVLFRPNFPFKGQKKNMNEGGLRVPAFVRDRECHQHVKHIGGSYENCLDLKRNGKMSYKLMHVTDWFPTIVSMASPLTNQPVPLYNDRWGYTEIASGVGARKLSGYDFWDEWINPNPNTKMYSPRDGIVFAAGAGCDSGNWVGENLRWRCISARYKNSYISTTHKTTYENAVETGTLPTWQTRFKYNGGGTISTKYMNAMDDGNLWRCYAVKNEDNENCNEDNNNCDGLLTAAQFQDKSNAGRDPDFCNIDFPNWLDDWFTSNAVITDLRIHNLPFNLAPVGETADTGHRCGEGYSGEQFSENIGSRTHLIDNHYESIGKRFDNEYTTKWVSIPDYHRYWTVGWYERDYDYLNAANISTTMFKQLFVLAEAKEYACKRRSLTYDTDQGTCIYIGGESHTGRRLNDLGSTYEMNDQGHTFVIETNCELLERKENSEGDTKNVDCQNFCNVNNDCIAYNYNSGENKPTAEGCYLMKGDCGTTVANDNAQGYRRIFDTHAPTPAPTTKFPTLSPTPPPTDPTAAPTPFPTPAPIPTPRPTPETVCHPMSYYGFESTSGIAYNNEYKPHNCYNGDQNCLNGNIIGGRERCCPGDTDAGKCKLYESRPGICDPEIDNGCIAIYYTGSCGILPDIDAQPVFEGNVIDMQKALIDMQKDQSEGSLFWCDENQNLHGHVRFEQLKGLTLHLTTAIGENSDDGVHLPWNREFIEENQVKTRFNTCTGTGGGAPSGYFIIGACKSKNYCMDSENNYVKCAGFDYTDTRWCTYFGVCNGGRRRLSDYGHQFWPCCAPYFYPNPDYVNPSLACQGELDYPEYVLDVKLHAARDSMNGLLPCIPYQFGLWGDEGRRRIKGDQFPSEWNWDHRPMSGPLVSIQSDAAIFTTQEQVTLLATLNGLVSPVMNDEVLTGMFYISHPSTDPEIGDVYQDGKTYDGLESCQYGNEASFLPLVSAVDKLGFEEISISVDLLRCAQRYEYYEPTDCLCIWNDAEQKYKKESYQDGVHRSCADSGEQCAWKNEDIPTDIKSQGMNWHFQFNFVHCIVPATFSGSVTNNLLSYITLFSDDNTKLNPETPRDALRKMFPAFHGFDTDNDGIPLSRLDMWSGTSFLSHDFQTAMYDWGVNGCDSSSGEDYQCKDNPFGNIRPSMEHDSFIFNHDQRCFNVQVPVRIEVPFDSNPLIGGDDIKFAVGDMVNLGKVTLPPTTTIIGATDSCESTLTREHIDVDSCYHTPRPNYNDDAFVGGEDGLGYTSPFTSAMCDGVQNAGNQASKVAGRPLWFKDRASPTESGSDFANVEFGTQYLGYPFRYDFWINRRPDANAIDGCASPYELLDDELPSTEMSDFQLAVRMEDAEDIRSTGNKELHGVLVEYATYAQQNTAIRTNRYVIAHKDDARYDNDHTQRNSYDFKIDLVCNDNSASNGGNTCGRNRATIGPNAYEDDSRHGWSVSGRTWEPDPMNNTWVTEMGQCNAITYEKGHVCTTPHVLWGGDADCLTDGTCVTGATPLQMEEYLRHPMCKHPLTTCRLHLVFDFEEFEDKGSEGYSPLSLHKYTENTYYESAVGKVVWYRDVGRDGFDSRPRRVTSPNGIHAPSEYLRDRFNVDIWDDAPDAMLEHNMDSTPTTCSQNIDDTANCRYYKHYSKAEPFMVTHDSWFGTGTTAKSMFTARKFELRRLLPYTESTKSINWVNTNLAMILKKNGKLYTDATYSPAGDLREWMHDVYDYKFTTGTRQYFDAIVGGCRGSVTCPGYVLAADAVDVTEDELQVLPRLRRSRKAGIADVEPCSGINPDGTGTDDRDSAYGPITCPDVRTECVGEPVQEGCKHSLCEDTTLTCWKGTMIDSNWGFPSCTPKHFDWWSDEFSLTGGVTGEPDDKCNWEYWFTAANDEKGKFNQWVDLDNTFGGFGQSIGNAFGSLRPCRDTSDCSRWFPFNHERDSDIVGPELFGLAENDDYAGATTKLPKYFHYKPVCSTRMTGGSLPGINGWDYNVNGMAMNVGSSSDFITLNDRRALDWFDKQRHKLNDGVRNRKPMKFCTWYSEDVQQAKKLLSGATDKLLPRDTWTDQFYGGNLTNLNRRSMTRPPPTECYDGPCEESQPDTYVPDLKFDSGGNYMPDITQLTAYELEADVYPPDLSTIETLKTIKITLEPLRMCDLNGDIAKDENNIPLKIRYPVRSPLECYKSFLKLSGADQGTIEKAIDSNTAGFLNYKWHGVTSGLHPPGCTIYILSNDLNFFFDIDEHCQNEDGLKTCTTLPNNDLYYGKLNPPKTNSELKKHILVCNEEPNPALDLTYTSSDKQCDPGSRVDTLVECYKSYEKMLIEINSPISDIRETHRFEYGVDRRDRGRCIVRVIDNDRDGILGTYNIVAWNPNGNDKACGATENASRWDCVCGKVPEGDRRRLSTPRQLEVVINVEIEEDTSVLNAAAYAYADVECMHPDWEESVWLCMQDYVFHATDIFYYAIGAQGRVRVGTTINLLNGVQTRLDLCTETSNLLCDVAAAEDEVSENFLWYAVGGMAAFFCFLVPLVLYRRRRDNRYLVVRNSVPHIDLESMDTVVEKVPLVLRGLRMPW